jgi:hypothetical protein
VSRPCGPCVPLVVTDTAGLATRSPRDHPAEPPGPSGWATVRRAARPEDRRIRVACVAERRRPCASSRAPRGSPGPDVGPDSCLPIRTPVLTTIRPSGRPGKRRFSRRDRGPDLPLTLPVTRASRSVRARWRRAFGAHRALRQPGRDGRLPHGSVRVARDRRSHLQPGSRAESARSRRSATGPPQTVAERGLRRGSTGPDGPVRRRFARFSLSRHTRGSPGSDHLVPPSGAGRAPRRAPAPNEDHPRGERAPRAPCRCPRRPPRARRGSGRG